jgi:transcriptional regulator GlxA family with amidase domain
LRVANAKNLLQSENLSVTQIAEQSGFSSASYFIQVFAKAVGESPEKYRRRFYTK